MNSVKENRAKWVEALRSGEYKQGDTYLKMLDKYCCLGVLCDVYEKETGNILEKDEGGGYKVYEETLENLSQVQEWVGLESSEGAFQARESIPAKALTVLNDDYSEWDFDKIADLIESEPEGLFV